MLSVPEPFPLIAAIASLAPRLASPMTMPDRLAAASAALAQASRVTSATAPAANPAARAEHDQHGQRHPRAGDGCGRAGEIRPSGPAHGRGRHRDRAVHALSEIRSGRSGMAGSRPLRALGRPRLDAALRTPLSSRLREDDDRRDQALPPAWLAHARPSRTRPHARRRNHHRPARPGTRQRRRHGDCRTASRRRVRRRGGRSHDLRARLRRRPDGRASARRRSRSPGT